MINCLPVPSRKLNDHSNLKPEVAARSQQAVTSLGCSIKRFTPEPLDIQILEKRMASEQIEVFDLFQTDSKLSIKRISQNSTGHGQETAN